MRNFLINILFWLLKFEDPLRKPLKHDTMIDLLSRTYQSLAVMQWMDERERQLIELGMEEFMDGKLERAERLAGQVYEVRMLKKKMKVCYNLRSRKDG